MPRRAGTRLDIPGAIVLFVGLLCIIGPLLFGRDVHWAAWVWLVMAAGVAVIAGFVRLERGVAKRGGMPLIELVTVRRTAAFMRGLGAVFFFFFANLSFYLVMTMFMQKHAAVSAAASRAGGRAARAGLRGRVAPQRRAGQASRHAGADRGLRGANSSVLPRMVVTRSYWSHRRQRLADYAGADGVRLWTGTGDGAAVERRALHREARPAPAPARAFTAPPRRSVTRPALR